MSPTNYETYHWKLVNFVARRIIGPSFLVGGIVLTLFGLYSVFVVGAVNVDGQPSTDPIFLAIAVLLPVLVAGLGVALIKVRPYYPPAPSTNGRSEEHQNGDAV